MNAEQYTVLALRTAPITPNNLKHDLAHAVMGIGGEAGEVVDIVKKHIYYGKDLDRIKVLEEMGDIFWYANFIIHLLDSSWGEVFDMNIKKLEKRYPNLRFEAEHAINRDVGAEQDAMRAGALA
jgi:NTP pyrophosphatase (non-canonical NTP hydrolase)